jgi:membrane protease YdiL (CAAX protease family)
MRTHWGRIAAFFATATVATYSLGYLVKNLRADGKPSMAESAATANLLMLVPGLVAVVFVALVLKRPLRSTLGLRWTPNRWWLVAWILPAVMAAAMIGMRLIAPGAEFTPPRSGPWAMLPVVQPWGALVAGLFAGATVCLPGALGEELAWRGYLQHEVQHLGFWRASLVIAFAWIGWHLPPLLLAGQGFGISVNLLVTTPLIVFIRNRGGSVLAAALFHGTMSGTWLIPGAMVTGGGSPARFMGAVPGALCLLLVLLAHPRLTRLEPASAKSRPADPIAT